MLRYIVSILILGAVLVSCNGSSDSGENTESAAATDDITPETTELVEDAATEVATESLVATAVATDDITPEGTEAMQADTTEVATAPSIATAQPTDPVTPDALATPDAATTMQALDTATPEAMATQAATEQVLRPNNGDYSINVSYVLDQTPEDNFDSSNLVVVASLGNQTSRGIEVSAGDLFLVDSEANRFEPEPPSSETQPPLVGADIPPNQSFLGLALFELPSDSIPVYLEWCIAGDCEQTVQAPIP